MRFITSPMAYTDGEVVMNASSTLTDPSFSSSTPASPHLNQQTQAQSPDPHTINRSTHNTLTRTLKTDPHRIERPEHAPGGKKKREDNTRQGGEVKGFHLRSAVRGFRPVANMATSTSSLEPSVRVHVMPPEGFLAMAVQLVLKRRSIPCGGAGASVSLG